MGRTGALCVTAAKSLLNAYKVNNLSSGNSGQISGALSGLLHSGCLLISFKRNPGQTH